MKRTWIVSGTWDRTGEPGWVTLHCDTRAEADALARARGLTVLEAMCAGGDPAAAATNSHAPTTRATRPAPPVKPPPPSAKSFPPHVTPPAAPPAAKFPPPPPVVAPPPPANATPPSRAPARRRMSPSRQAAIEVDPSADGRWSPTSGLILLAVGLLIVVVGTYLTTSPSVGHWTGEFVQLVGAAAVLIGLRILSS